MPRKPSRRLHERLDDLFTGLPAPEPDQGAQAQPRPSVAVPGGWLWESDLEGRYTWCSPELTTFLGLNPDQIVAHAVADVGLVAESADHLRGRMTDPSALENVRLTYRGADGGQVHVLLTADIRPGIDGRPAGLRGVVQVLEMTRPNGDGRPAEAPPAPPPEPAEEEIPPEMDVFTPWAEHKPATAKAEPANPPAAPTAPQGQKPGTGSLDRPSRPIRRRQTGRLPRAASLSPAPAAPAAPAPSAAEGSKPGTGDLSLDRPSRPVRRRTGRLSPEVAAEADATRLAVTAPQSADQVSPFEPAPLIATWGPATAYVDSGDAIQPLTLDSPEAIREPQIRGGRLLVPIRVQDEVMGVLAFEESEAGRPWTQDDIDMALAISQQLGVTLQDARSAQLTQVALDEMREADRLKTQFLANMSHELRTPLNSIIGFSRVILKGIDGPVNDTQEQDLRAIHGAGLHLLGLINDILDVSKIEAGKMELTFGEVDLAEIVRGVMSTAVALVKEKSIDLRTELADDLPLVQADSIRVRQVLLNLLSNAAKFTDQGYILVTARPIDEGGEREVLVSVEDTGPGIALTDQNKLFVPFSQVDASPTRKTGGTGLGLSICRHLVELHGGSIWVESTPGEGSVFYFTLPVEQALALPEGGEAPLVLAVDDNPSVLARYRSTLESLGYRFQALPQADGVVELATQLQPGVLVIDPHLPSQGSWNLIQGLRASPVTRTIPIVLGSFAPDTGRAFRLHAADVLLKPCSGADVTAAVKRLLPPDKPSPSILLVDDDSAELHELHEELTEAGTFHVELAAGGNALYQSARRKIPDAIVLHLFMARAEGFRALEVVRKDPVLKAIPLILMASPQPHTEERRQLALYTEYLQRQGTASEADYLADVRGLVQAYAPLA